MSRDGDTAERDPIVGYAMDHPEASQREIADVFGVCQSTVSSRLREYFPEHPTVRGANPYLHPGTDEWEELAELVDRMPPMPIQNIAYDAGISPKTVRRFIARRWEVENHESG